MAREFWLYLATQSNSEKLLDMIPGFGKSSNAADNSLPKGLWAVNYGIVSDHEKDRTQKAFGFKANVSVYFRLDKFDDYQAGVKNTILATNEILKREAGDACLWWADCERAMLLRAGDQLVLNNAEEFWTSAPHFYKELISGAYKIELLKETDF